MVQVFICALVLSAAISAHAHDAGALRSRHAALKEQLANNPFGRPLHVESAASGNAQKGEIYAVIEQPFSVVAPALARPAQWCEVLMLQVNVKRCEAENHDALTAFITRRARDAVESAHRVDFRYQVVKSSADYAHAALNAPSGPVGTRDYEIRLEVAPLDARRTFVHMSYAYTLGLMARLAMDAYLSTGAGRDKRGFTVEGGERGVVERSTMRHFLAIEAYLDSLGEPPAERLEARLRRWYEATARYPQLRESVGADEYVEMKRKEAG